MATIFGTIGNDTYTGSLGVDDTAVIASGQAETIFNFNGANWIVSSLAGTDTLVSIEQAQLNDAIFGLAIGGETLVNTTTTNNQFRPQITHLASGNYVVVWEDSTDGNGAGIFMQTFTPLGERLGAQARVNTTITGFQQIPSVAALSGGGFVVGWTSTEQDTDGSSSVYIQRYDAAGAPVGTETQVNTTTAGVQNGIVLTGLANGGYVASWVSPDASLSGIYMQIYNSAGTPVGTETLVNTTTTSSQIDPAITTLANGQFLISWTSAAGDGNADGVFFQRYSATGVALGSETLVNTSIIGSQNQSSVAELANGEFLVAWTGLDVSGTGVFVQRFSATGIKIGEETLVNTSTNTTQNSPAVTALANGGYVVTWVSFSPNPLGDNSGTAVYMQVFDANGSKVGRETLVNSSTGSNQFEPSISASADGGFVVTWQSDGGQDGSANGVFSQRFDANGVHVYATITGDLAPNAINIATNSGQNGIIGGAGNDRLTGGNGIDVLTGGLGNDRLAGGAGNDIYYTEMGDTIVEAVGQGVDTAYVNSNYTITVRNLEAVVLYGSSAANLTGNNEANILIGNAADNVLNGGQGIDVMEGRNGNDTYFVDISGDSVIEEVNAGIDTVVSQVSLTLSANVENLRLIGSAVNGAGNDLANQITGNANANTLAGNGGADILIGGDGFDNYIVDALDIIIEEADEGIDTVFSTVSWVLGDNFERLSLSGNGNINGTGNELANEIYGSFGNNVLDGGEGADFMDGDSGDDTYIVDNVLDVAIETSNSNADSVISSVSYTLLQGIEILTLTGSANLDGIGNGSNNIIRGNAGSNILQGGFGVDSLFGGVGNDTLISIDENDRLAGGLGNDVYQVGSDGDEIVELANQGTDTVISSAFRSYTLAINLENLVLTGLNADGYGNNLDNQITGSIGNNLLDGAGGADQLTGMAGNDVYIVDNAGDLVTEALSEGTDQVLSSVTYILTANVEHLTLTGAELINGAGNAMRNRIVGNDQRNRLDGFDGNDNLIGGGGNDLIFGGNGDDKLTGDIGNDRLEGGGGFDTANYFSTIGGVTVSLAITVAQNTVSAGTDTLITVENVEGSNTGGDTLTGNAGANRLFGHGGNDTINAGGGNDRAYGGEGNDVFLADVGNDLLDGGNGTDLVTFFNFNGDITVNLNLTGSQNTGLGQDDLRNIENVEGSFRGNDVLIGDFNANSLFGSGGDDVLVGGEGNDVLDGGAGIDLVDYSQVFDGVIVNLAANSADDDGFDNVDTLINIENVIGGEFEDVLIGSDDANALTGGLDRDILTGNGANDRFVYRSAVESSGDLTLSDVITDFSTGDIIDLALIDANTATVGDDAFTVIRASNQAFTAAGQLRLTDGVLYGNTDGDAEAEFAIILTGVTAINLTDFTL